MNRYSRHIILSEIGQKGQDKLATAKVLIVGAGGLGCPVLQYLTAAGIGTIGIIDDDNVALSNLQRQPLFGTSSLGKNKALAAKKRLQDLNDAITLHAYPEKLTYVNAISLFDQYDIIVDGTDNFETRYLINDACIIADKPFVFGAIYKFEGQVSVFNFQNGPSYRCLFPHSPKKGSVPNCSDIGVLGVLPGIIGSMQANEVLKMILNIGDVLSGKLLCYNALTSQTTILTIKKNQGEFEKVLRDKDHFHKKELEYSCETSIEEVSFRDFLNKGNFQLIDVRETHEKPEVIGLPVTRIPLNELQERLEEISHEKEKLVFCQSNIRSKQAVLILNQNHFKKCYCLKEGASEIIRYMKDLQKQITNDG